MMRDMEQDSILYLLIVFVSFEIDMSGSTSCLNDERIQQKFLEETNARRKLVDAMPLTLDYELVSGATEWSRCLIDRNEMSLSMAQTYGENLLNYVPVLPKPFKFEDASPIERWLGNNSDVHQPLLTKSVQTMGCAVCSKDDNSRHVIVCRCAESAVTEDITKETSSVRNPLFEKTSFDQTMVKRLNTKESFDGLTTMTSDLNRLPFLHSTTAKSSPEDGTTAEPTSDKSLFEETISSKSTTDYSPFEYSTSVKSTSSESSLIDDLTSENDLVPVKMTSERSQFDDTTYTIPTSNIPLDDDVTSVQVTLSYSPFDHPTSTKSISESKSFEDPVKLTEKSSFDDSTSTNPSTSTVPFPDSTTTVKSIIDEPPCNVSDTWTSDKSPCDEWSKVASTTGVPVDVAPIEKTPLYYILMAAASASSLMVLALSAIMCKSYLLGRKK